MSHEQRKKVLRYFMFPKEKCDGTIKARGCVDGRLQKENIAKSDRSSPIVSLEAMMMSFAIDAKENRYVPVTDVPGAFLHADMEEEVHLLHEGTIAELIIKLNPKLYRKYIWRNQNEKPMLCLNSRRPFMGHCKLSYYSGGYYVTPL